MIMKNMKLKSGLFAFGVLAVAGSFGAPALAQSQAELKPLKVAMAEGNYAGTFICSSGEMGMSLSLKDTGPASIDMIGEEPCRSGSGPCNDAQAARLKDMRTMSGVINFFPTAGNPDAPAGAFHVRGTANYGSKYRTRLELSPGKWIDQPEGFGASGLSGSIVDGKVYGKPTAQGCYTLKMRKIRTQ